ncbi:hypothetical protein CK203_083106 [Vitis vinifera]|uniref:Uncharacterized protein n=1 Tax=Vitis vinifera TaxID=29760 RepID=A0A438EA73_VITVI|nr:hypothetical protein CK203_083106 [Vitis vinifera]
MYLVVSKLVQPWLIKIKAWNSGLGLILQNYEDILQKNQFYLQDKGKLKNALAGLVRCLTLLPCNTREVVSSFEENLAGQRVLHAFEPDLPKDPADPRGVSFIPLLHLIMT